MDLNGIIDKLECDCKCCHEGLKNEVTGGYAGDLLSDVMANSSRGDIWVTRQIHQNIIAVACLNDLSGILITQGAIPEDATLEKARSEGMPVMVTRMPEFEAVGRIYHLLHYREKG
ncbi:MAG: serine kinase [Thermodesulfobacteriota bacterium]|nr:serine kinase [Thermodesulfobacteriota bacterium]